MELDSIFRAAMNILFSSHAYLRMLQRNIDETEVEQAIRYPDRRDFVIRNRQIVYKRLYDKIIQIVYTVEDGIIVVITVILYAEKS